MRKHPRSTAAPFVPTLAAVVFGVALLLVGGGCANSRAVLHQGVHLGAQNKLTRVSGGDAERAALQARASWRRDLEGRARSSPDERFANLAPAELRRRLAKLASRYDFTIVSLKVLRPQQVAPEIVVRTRHYVALARATRLILQQIDPKAPTGDDRTGWRFEGFYFQADDERGIPFLIVFNFWRGVGGGGGQWARSDRLFPFPHG